MVTRPLQRMSSQAKPLNPQPVASNNGPAFKYVQPHAAPRCETPGLSALHRPCWDPSTAVHQHRRDMKVQGLSTCLYQVHLPLRWGALAFLAPDRHPTAGACMPRGLLAERCFMLHRSGGPRTAQPLGCTRL